MIRIIFLLTVVISTASAHAANGKLSISAEAFGQLENFESISLSPEGNRLASLRNYKGRIVLVTQSLNPGKKDQLYITSFKEGEFNWFHWLSNDRLAVSIRFPARRYGSKSTETRLIAQNWDRKNPVNLIKRQKRKYSSRGTREVVPLCWTDLRRC